MTNVIVLNLGTVVGQYEVVGRVENSSRGDARYCVKCSVCGRKTIKRGTEVRKALREGCDWVCKHEVEAKAAARKQSERQEREARQQVRLEYREYIQKHILLYYTWGAMKARCTRESHPKYKHYGARGIQVCSEWRDDFVEFCQWSLTHGYRKGLTLDRRDNDQGYCPENCRWTTQVVQQNNKRSRDRVIEDLKKFS